MQTLTSQYPFHQMAVGDSFTVTDRFQHARVAASEYSRRNGVVFTCRKQDDGSMKVYRCENNQAPVDRRGAKGRRRIVQAIAEPSKHEFMSWLQQFTIGQVYIMPVHYSHVFAAMEAWCDLAAYESTQRYACERSNGTLRITRLN